MRKGLLIGAGSVALLIAIVVAVGFMLPVEHVASGSVSVARSPDWVHRLLTDVHAYPSWRSDVRQVEVLQGTATRWRERGSNGEITFEVLESRPPARLVTRIADESLPFGGTWTFELLPDGEGTRVTITEQGKVFNPVFRFVSRFVFGHAATIERYLADLTAAAARQSSLSTRTHTDATRWKIRLTRSKKSPSLIASAT